VSSPDEVIKEVLARVAEARIRFPLVERMIPGVHLECYPAPGALGCHNPRNARPPDWSFIDSLGGLADLICLITVAPELDGAIIFILNGVRAGKKMAIGHTLASSLEISAAYDAGACLSTHLGNGAPAELPRHGKGNPLWRQFAISNLHASLIADFQHIDSETLRDFVTIKGIHRSIIVTDSIFAAGLGEGEYEFSGQKIVVKRGRAYLKNRPEVLAGSVTSMLECLDNLLKIGLQTNQALHMMSAGPALLMNWNLEGSSLTVERNGEGAKVKSLLMDGERMI